MLDTNDSTATEMFERICLASPRNNLMRNLSFFCCHHPSISPYSMLEHAFALIEHNNMSTTRFNKIAGYFLNNRDQQRRVTIENVSDEGLREALEHVSPSSRPQFLNLSPVIPQLEQLQHA